MRTDSSAAQEDSVCILNAFKPPTVGECQNHALSTFSYIAWLMRQVSKGRLVGLKEIQVYRHNIHPNNGMHFRPK